MTEPFDEYGERLRRVLHAEADAVAPSAEGLEQIRTKIAERADRRFTAWLAAPWLRPLAAAAAAVCLAVVAVSATPALKTFVQTGHFDSGAGHDGGTSSVDGRYTGGQAVPPGSAHSGPAVSSHPTAVPTTTPDTHVVTGRKCPSGEKPVGRSGGPAPSTAPTPRLTCTSAPTPPTSPTDVTSTPPTSPPPPPTAPATNGGAGPEPSAQSSP